MIKKLLAALLCATLLLSVWIPVFGASGDTESGLSFSALGTYPVMRAYRETPRTLEAVLRVPEEQAERAGVILSNKPEEGGDVYLSLEIFKNGAPRLVYKDAAGIQYDFRFEGTDVRSDGWVHLAITHDAEAGEVRCYLDGTLSETLTADRTGKEFSDYHADIEKTSFLIGGDRTVGNEFYFKGELRSLALFDRARSAAEISADVAGVEASDASLLALYDMAGITATEDILDRSSYKAHATCEREWFDGNTGAYTGEYDFSLAVVGDTQNFIWREAADQPKYRGVTAGLYSWIVDQVAPKNIQYVIGLGDIVDTDSDPEWELAKSGITLMDGVVPYTLIRGHGHDSVTKLNRYFADHTPFTENLGGTFLEGSVANSYQTFSYGGTDYLIFGFDFGAPDDVLAWADGIVAEHPNHRIIVTTHAYLDADGSTLDRGEVANATGYADDANHNKDPEKYVPDGRDSDAPFNDGKTIWERFASKHKNVFMVISGHEIVEDIVINQREGQNGNTVTEILIDPQGMDDNYETYDGGVGMVSMFYFDLDAETVAIEYYSTVQKAYRRLNVIDLNHKHVFEDIVVPSTCKDKGYRVRSCACGEEQSRFTLSLSTTHTYDSDTDAECNVCGKVRKIETETEESVTETLTPSLPLPETETVPEESASLPETDTETEPVTEVEPETERETEGETAAPTELQPEESTAPTDPPTEESASSSEENTESSTDAVPPPDPDGMDGGNIGLIVGITVGAAVLLGGGATAGVLIFKKRRTK